MAAGAFGGLISAGIAAAFEGNAIASWRWLFIIEGSVTVVAAVAIVFIIPDWPSTTRWLSAEEKALGILRLREDSGEEEGDNSMTAFHAMKLAVSDYRVWLCIIGQMSMQAVASLTNFLPTLVAEFGQGQVVTLLLTAPPYAAAAVYSVIACFWSDRLSKRSPFIIFPTLVAAAGIIITLTTANAAARYAALFLMLPGTYGCFQISNAWMANIAARPAKKRGIALALNNGIGNSALVWTPYLYDASMGPGYTLAWSVNLGLLVVLLVSTMALSLILRRANNVLSIEGGGDVLAGERLRREGGASSTGFERLGKKVVDANTGGNEGKGGFVNRFDT